MSDRPQLRHTQRGDPSYYASFVSDLLLFPCDSLCLNIDDIMMTLLDYLLNVCFLHTVCLPADNPSEMSRSLE